jgi:hypothetical protein
MDVAEVLLVFREIVHIGIIVASRSRQFFHATVLMGISTQKSRVSKSEGSFDLLPPTCDTLLFPLD